jgi:hypothetical protein
MTMTQNDNRRRPSSLMRRIRGYRKAAPALLAAALLVPAAPAGAAVTIGQLSPSAPPASCPPDYDYLQDGVTGGNFYSAQEAGTITSWSTRSSGAGARYDFKVLRRTSDPDIFRVVGRAAGRTLSPGVNTFGTGLHVESGDLIGLHEQGGGGFNSCTFPMPGDAVLRAPGDAGAGSTERFAPVTDVRLNLRAVLVPANDFTVTAISRNRHRGTAILTLETSNPGIVTIGGKGLKKKRPAKSRAVAGPLSFAVAVVGKRRHKLSRRGSLVVAVNITFTPPGGDPSLQTIPVKLKQKKRRPPEPV